MAEYYFQILGVWTFSTALDKALYLLLSKKEGEMDAVISENCKLMVFDGGILQVNRLKSKNPSCEGI